MPVTKKEHSFDMQISNRMNRTKAGFLAAVALLLLTAWAQAQDNPLLEADFWKTATIQDVQAAIAGGADIHARTDVGRTSLYLAAENSESLELVAYLLELGADVNSRDAGGWSPLHGAAAWCQNLAVIELLLEQGADINIRSIFGKNPLHQAATFNTAPVVELLLNRGADATARDEDGLTPFDHARTNGHLVGTDVYWHLSDSRFQ